MAECLLVCKQHCSCLVRISSSFMKQDFVGHRMFALQLNFFFYVPQPPINGMGVGGVYGNDFVHVSVCSSVSLSDRAHSVSPEPLIHLKKIFF